MTDALAWRLATEADIDAIMDIQDEVHTLSPERREVLIDKMQACPDGCFILEKEALPVGYGITHPWFLDDVPALDAVLEPLGADPNCLFIHDVAIRSRARSGGAARQFVRVASAVAIRRGLPKLALLSVYGTVPIWSRLGFRTKVLLGLADKFSAYGPTARYMIADVPDFPTVGLANSP